MISGQARRHMAMLLLCFTGEETETQRGWTVPRITYLVNGRTGIPTCFLLYHSVLARDGVLPLGPQRERWVWEGNEDSNYCVSPWETSNRIWLSPDPNQAWQPSQYLIPRLVCAWRKTGCWMLIKCYCHINAGASSDYAVKFTWQLSSEIAAY